MSQQLLCRFLPCFVRSEPSQSARETSFAYPAKSSNRSRLSFSLPTRVSDRSADSSTGKRATKRFVSIASSDAGKMRDKFIFNAGKEKDPSSFGNPAEARVTHTEIEFSIDFETKLIDSYVKVSFASE